ncbi:hypothetical protein [Curtobacterium luteum]|uniref:hypothetical protein n=1 Tax=Curtobacterium luteum TaxID=33881 RepID=UPI0038012EC0
MTTNPTERGPIVAVPDADLAAAAVQPGGIARLAARVVASGAPVLAIGTDRFDPGHRTADRPEPTDGSVDRPTARLDPTTAALALAAALPGHGFLVATAPTREHPYNVARRVLSLDHVLGGRVGVIVGAHDHGAPSVEPEHDAGEFARVLRGLWRTWPLDSIVGDREAGVFAHTDAIRPLDHDGGPGGYRVRGPLTTPSSPQGEPVLAVWHDVDLPEADLVLGGDVRPLLSLPIDGGAAAAARGRTGVAPGSGPGPDADHGSRARVTLRALLGLEEPAVRPAPAASAVSA